MAHKVSKREYQKQFATRLDYEEFVAHVAKLTRQGYSVSDIAMMTNRSRNYISGVLKVIYERYEETRVHSRQAMIQEHLDKLADVRMEAWKAWYASMSDEEKVQEEYGHMDFDDPEVLAGPDQILHKLKVIISKKGRLPENAYLSSILKTFEAERKLLGLDAPKAEAEVASSDVLDWNSLLRGAALVTAISNQNHQQAPALPAPRNAIGDLVLAPNQAQEEGR